MTPVERLRAFQRELESGHRVTRIIAHIYGGILIRYKDAAKSFASDLGALLDEREALRGALIDMSSGWQYIRRYHGDLYGVGWDRCEQSADAALSMNSVSGEIND